MLEVILKFCWERCLILLPSSTLNTDLKDKSSLEAKLVAFLLLSNKTSFRCIKDVILLLRESFHDFSGVTYICRDTGMCHYFGDFFGLLPDFWVPIWAIPDFWVPIFGCSRIFGHHFFW